MNRIKLGLIGMAIPDLFMGEEMCPDKTRELQVYLEGLGYEVKAASDIALSASDARRLGRELNDPDIDCIVVAVSTFIGDYYMSELVASADKPLFLWLIERELQCITLVAGPLCAAALKDLHHPYCISSDDIGGVYTTEKLRVFALACRAVNRTKMMHIGFCGGKASHMFSQSCDEIALRNMTGATVVHIPLEELYAAFEEADEGQAEALWGKLTEEVGCVKSPLASGIESCKYYLASKKLVERYEIDAISLNCFPYLKAKICLPVSLLTDEGIPAGCEGSILDTLLMKIAWEIGGKAPANADVLRMYPDKNDMVFSHCGAGAMTLAASPRDISLEESIETHSGVSVYYDTYMKGIVTMANLVSDDKGMRLSCTAGKRLPDESGYQGNPIYMHFEEPVRAIYDRMCEFGSGVHFIGLDGDYCSVFEELARLWKIPYKMLGR